MLKLHQPRVGCTAQRRRNAWPAGLACLTGLALIALLPGGCPIESPLTPTPAPSHSDDLDRLPNPVFDRIIRNQRPTANAGADQVVESGVEVSLNGAASRDPDLDQLFFFWRQIGGEPAVDLQGGQGSAIVRFVAPDVETTTVFTFSLTVGDGFATDVAQVVVTVTPRGS